MTDRPRALAVLIAVFLIGTILGTAGAYIWFKPDTISSGPFNRMGPPRPNGLGPNSRGPNGRGPNSPGRMKPPEYNLTPEQDKKVWEIASETRKKIKALEQDIWKQTAELYQKRAQILEENDRQIRAILDEEQIEVYDEWMKKFPNLRERMPRRMGPESPKEIRKKPEQQ